MRGPERVLMAQGGGSPGEAADVIYRDIQRDKNYQPSPALRQLREKGRAISLSTRWGDGMRGDKDLL